MGWFLRVDDLPWLDPQIAVAALLNGTADGAEWQEAEAYLSDLRDAAVRRGMLTVTLPAGALVALLALLDPLLTLVRGLA